MANDNDNDGKKPKKVIVIVQEARDSDAPHMISGFKAQFDEDVVQRLVERTPNARAFESLTEADFNHLYRAVSEIVAINVLAVYSGVQMPNLN